MPQVVLLRHGQTDHNRKLIMQGLLDVPLNKVGAHQAEAVADWLHETCRFDRIYCSSLQRARQTAEPIARRQDCQLQIVPALREMNVGAWQGLTYRQAEARDPEIWQELMRDPLHTCRPGGESFADVYRRVIDWWQQVIEPLDEHTKCCVVTHGVPVRSILAYALAIDPVDFSLRMSLKNTGVSALEYDRQHQRWLAHSINATCHLGSLALP